MKRVELNKASYIAARTRFRVKIKSLTAESKIILAELRKLDPQSFAYGSAYAHREHVVGRESRHTLLAYAFLRGKSYKTVEAKCFNPPAYKDVHRILKSLVYFNNEEDVKAWLAGEEFEPLPPKQPQNTAAV